jgi:hypothetical protein|tara:strand:- start:51 stop:467 length:417 start_codon:yes stop_codon:yes gene_type:complete
VTTVKHSYIIDDTLKIFNKEKNMIAICTEINGKKRFLGKHIDDEIIREFPFSKAVLWQKKDLGFDIRLLKYAENHNVKSFIFSDPIKAISLKIGVRAAKNQGRKDEYGEGTQWYVPKSIMKRLDKYRKTPYIKKEVML